MQYKYCKIIATVILVAIIAIIAIINPSLLKDTEENKENDQPNEEKLLEEKLPLGESFIDAPHISPDFYSKIRTWRVNKSYNSLKKKGEEAKKLISGFPSLPEILPDRPKNRGKFRSMSERHCVLSLEAFFPNYKFTSVRPKWLKNPPTGRSLELDGYNSKLKIAIEYNGIQHYKWPNYTRCSYKDFLKQRDRDLHKQKVCINKGICLLTVPYTVSYRKLPLAVYCKLLDSVPGLTPEFDNLT